MSGPGTDFEAVSNAILHEIQGVMGLARYRWAQRLVGLLFGAATRRLAGLLVRLDGNAATYGLGAAAGNLLASLVHEYRVDCPQAIPQDGPLLVVSNHPGAYDMATLTH